jgi:hypothetical protein
MKNKNIFLLLLLTISTSIFAMEEGAPEGALSGKSFVDELASKPEAVKRGRVPSPDDARTMEQVQNEDGMEVDREEQSDDDASSRHESERSMDTSDDNIQVVAGRTDGGGGKESDTDQPAAAETRGASSSVANTGEGTAAQVQEMQGAKALRSLTFYGDEATRIAEQFKILSGNNPESEPTTELAGKSNKKLTEKTLRLRQSSGEMFDRNTADSLMKELDRAHTSEELEDIKNKINSYTDTSTSQKEKYKEVKQALNDRNEKTRLSNQGVREAGKEIKENNKKMTELDKLNKKVDRALDKRIESTEKQKAAAEKQKAAAEKQKAAAEKKLKTVKESKKPGLQAKVESLKEDIGSQEASIEHYTTRITEMTKAKGEQPVDFVEAQKTATEELLAQKGKHMKQGYEDIQTKQQNTIQQQAKALHEKLDALNGEFNDRTSVANLRSKVIEQAGKRSSSEPSISDEESHKMASQLTSLLRENSEGDSQGLSTSGSEPDRLQDWKDWSDGIRKDDDFEDQIGKLHSDDALDRDDAEELRRHRASRKKPVLTLESENNQSDNELNESTTDPNGDSGEQEQESRTDEQKKQDEINREEWRTAIKNNPNIDLDEHDFTEDPALKEELEQIKEEAKKPEPPKLPKSKPPELILGKGDRGETSTDEPARPPSLNEQI